MEDSKEATISETPEKESKKAPAFEQIAFAIFFAGCVQFILFGMIGVVRGYSVQSHLPYLLLVMGLLPLAAYYKKRPFLAFILPSLIIITSSVSMSQGGHEDAGDDFYEKGEYKKALLEYQKETETWYRRIQYNYHEESSLFKIAESYAQLEEFESARETYETIITRFSGLYKDRAEEALLNFEKINELKVLIGNQTDDGLKSMVLFELASKYRMLPSIKKARETYSIIQTLDIDEGLKKQAMNFLIDLFEEEMPSL